MWQSRTIVSGLIVLLHGVELQCSVKLNPFGAFQQVRPSEKKKNKQTNQPTSRLAWVWNYTLLNWNARSTRTLHDFCFFFMRETKSWEQKQSSSRLVSPYASDVINFSFMWLKFIYSRNVNLIWKRASHLCRTPFCMAESWLRMICLTQTRRRT